MTDLKSDLSCISERTPFPKHKLLLFSAGEEPLHSSFQRKEDVKVDIPEYNKFPGALII